MLTLIVVWPLVAKAEFEPKSALIVTPANPIAASGTQGGPFSPTSFQYRIKASDRALRFSITAPSWLIASPKFGTTDTNGVMIDFVLNPEIASLPSGQFGPSVSFTNLSNGRGSTTRPASLIIRPQQQQPGVSKGDSGRGYLLDDVGGNLVDDRRNPLLTK